MSFTIAAPTQADRTQWQALYQLYADFYAVPMSTSTLDTVWHWIHATDQAFYCLIAKNAEGEALGLMHYREMPSPLRGAKVGFLDDLFISPQARGNGLVQQMFAALEQASVRHGWPLVRWITADDNYRARAVYDSVAQKTHWLTYQLEVTHK
ncbi:MAG: GNAT family N-acetyltransferase [Pseudomonadales bacterium]